MAYSDDDDCEGVEPLQYSESTRQAVTTLLIARAQMFEREAAELRAQVVVLQAKRAEEQLGLQRHQEMLAAAVTSMRGGGDGDSDGGGITKEEKEQREQAVQMAERQLHKTSLDLAMAECKLNCVLIDCTQARNELAWVHND
jgi:hypothetical protein